jgi:hypothetical protein
MRNKRAKIITFVTLAAAVVGIGATVFHAQSASATSSAFVPVSAVENLAALNTTPEATLPAVVNRVPTDLRPVVANVYAVGGGGSIWRHQDGVCTVMASGAGGCFTTFDKPVVLYLTGTESHAGVYEAGRVEGILPNSIKALQLELSNGASVSAPVSNNGFDVALPADVGIAGYQVTLADGKTASYSDPVGVPQLAH